MESPKSGALGSCPACPTPGMVLLERTVNLNVANYHTAQHKAHVNAVYTGYSEKRATVGNTQHY
jgi:hypothetical protein